MGPQTVDKVERQRSTVNFFCKRAGKPKTRNEEKDKRKGGVIDAEREARKAAADGSGDSGTNDTGRSFAKRFQYDANNPAVYLTLTHFHNGQAIKAYFMLESASKVPPKPIMAPLTNTPQTDVTPTPIPLTSYPALAHGDRGDAVVKLQERLIELGYLSGEADGIFGNMTLSAVKEAQRIAYMEQTGIADNDFQQYLFSDNAISK